MTVDGFRIRHLASVTSTMDVAREAALAGEPDGLAVLADAQTGGRGRRGRSWISPRGNLYVSVLLRPEMPVATLGLFSFVASLALARALPPALERERVRLKWPNDVLVDGAKIAGILLETCATPQGMALIIGMGVNIATHPAAAGYPATSLGALGFDMARETPEVLLGRFLPLLRELGLDLQRNGFSGLRAHWLAQAAGLESAIVARLPDRELRGCFMGIDEKGCLLVRHPTGIVEKLSSGEVFAPSM